MNEAGPVLADWLIVQSWTWCCETVCLCEPYTLVRAYCIDACVLYASHDGQTHGHGVRLSVVSRVMELLMSLHGSISFTIMV